MVKITNGIEVFEVTQGAYDGIYSRQGFKLLKAKAKQEKQYKDKEPETDEQWAAIQEEKPLSGWTKEEAKRYAEIKGIDLTGTKSLNDAKEVIKEYL